MTSETTSGTGTIPRTRGAGIALAFGAAGVSGVAVFVNAYGVKHAPDGTTYTTAKNLVAAIAIIGVALVAGKPDRRKVGPSAEPRGERGALARSGCADDDGEWDLRTCVEGIIESVARDVPARKCGRRKLGRGH